MPDIRITAQWTWRALLPMAVVWLLLQVAQAGPAPPTPFPPPPQLLGLPNTSTTQPLVLKPFTDLPDPGTQHLSIPGTGRISPGTDGLTLPNPPQRAETLTLAILGDLAPQESNSARYLESTVAQLNLLQPDLVLSVGNLIPGMTRSGQRYVEDVHALRTALDTLTMPWYPCAGQSDVISGTQPWTAAARLPGVDRRFEELYRRFLGPLYYSLDAGALHAIVLDSEESVGGPAGANAISDTQLAWLKNDLNRTFERRQTRWVIVLIHRPLWRYNTSTEGGNWNRIQEMLVDFNRRPIVAVEGIGGGARPSTGPRITAVFAGSRRAYSLEPALDDIPYFVLGPTAAAASHGLNSAEALRGIMLIKFDHPPAEAMRPSILQLDLLPPAAPVGSAASSVLNAIRPADEITWRERRVLDQIGGWSNDSIGAEGILDPHLNTSTAVRIANRLTDPITVEFTLRESPWTGIPSSMMRRLESGAQDSWNVQWTRSESSPTHDAQILPPAIQFMVHWTDARGRIHDVVQSRIIPVIASAKIAIVPRVDLQGSVGWDDATQGTVYTWTDQHDEPHAPASAPPAWLMTADAHNFYIRIRVADATPSNWPHRVLDPVTGASASDAVCVAWAPEPGAAADSIQRLWAFPYASMSPGAPSLAREAELWTNTGPINRPTPLLKLDPQAGIQSALSKDRDGYTITLCLPRKLVFAGAAPVFNILVHDNQDSARTDIRSWSAESPGPQTYGHIELREETTPSGPPKTPS